MLTPRNVVAVVISVAVISLIAALLNLIWGSRPSELRADSFGTRAVGHRALIETLRELGLEVRRSAEPPRASRLGDTTFVLWNPRRTFVQAEPEWLGQVAQWVQDGGHVVLVSGPGMFLSDDFDRGEANEPEEKPRRSSPFSGSDPGRLLRQESVFKRLGLDGLRVLTFDSPAEAADEEETPFGKNVRKAGRQTVDEFIDELAQQQFSAPDRSPPVHCTVRSTGQWEASLKDVSEISVPLNGLSRLELGTLEPLAEIYATPEAAMVSETVREAGALRVGAEFSVGSGRVTVMCLPSLVMNSHIGQGDNIVLAARLLAAEGRPVVLDEFFHGGSLRGNPLWLVAQRTYGTVTLALVLLVAAIVWRSAVFLGPPLPDAPVKRRAITEYIEAMSRFLCEAKDHGPWMARQVCDGVLWALRREFNLPPEQSDLTQLEAAMARRDPERATQLVSTVRALEAELAETQHGGLKHWMPLLERMSACLSKHDIKPFGKRSPK